MRVTHMIHRIARMGLGAMAALNMLVVLPLSPVLTGYRSQPQAEADLTWDFEQGNLGDWVVAGQAQAISDGIDPLTDDAMRSVAQGSYAAMIGDAIPWGVSGAQHSSITRIVTVPQADSKPVLQFSYAVVANDPPDHPETAKPYFQLEVRDLTTGELLPVSNFKYTSQTSQEWFLGRPPNDQSLSQQSFSQISGDRWIFAPWRHETVDLSDHIGHQLQLQFAVRDCDPRGHPAYGYLDAIHLGAARSVPALPTLSKQAVPAGAPPAPSLLQTVSTPLEQWNLWPTCLLLPLLLGLGLAVAYFFRPQRVLPANNNDLSTEQTRQPNGAWTGAAGSTWQDQSRLLDGGDQPQGNQK